ncbi:M57 family metalloprotease [Companilactobacillus keshanensis]|uniref:M57 family metalloprotease n=1 Tax=Companilactobacillus keshanensis TaxID=2486003 RepID=A0ABW4BUC7_9LACO|nr:M57 family metalloprotease [Companilactobacillus keshanensis]
MKRSIILLGLIIVGGIAINQSDSESANNIKAQVIGHAASTTDYLQSKVNNFIKKEKIVQSTTVKDPTGEKTKTASENQTTPSNQTPILSIMNGFSVDNTYYYHFTKKTPSSVKQVFETAIDAYNNTGLVNLVAGTGTSKQNRITFSIYYKDEGNNASSIELGNGGPKLIYNTADVNKHAVNHATASINMNYSESVTASVAMHEVGHALGLDHSDDMNSVMYPTNQNVTQLSDGDIAGLKNIY